LRPNSAKNTKSGRDDFRAISLRDFLVRPAL
jgi:hypothetical protein